MTATFARLSFLAPFCLAAAGLTGCAQTSIGPTGAVGFAPAAGPAPQSAEAADYVLASEEAEFDCKRLAGKVQIRILEMRANMSPQETSALSRSLQSAFSGGMTAQAAGGAHASDFAQLEAFNRQLAEKNCRSFDLAKALGGNEAAPTPTVPARAAR